jgi:DhnA family fructose-bisphosphate aldolase class Ia
VLDSGALIAFEKNDRRVRTLVELAVAHCGALLTTGGVVAQVWRDGSRQARLARLLGSEVVRVQPLDRDEAQATGILCGEAGTCEVVDASVVLLARRYDATMVTSDADDLRRSDPRARLVRC